MKKLLCALALVVAAATSAEARNSRPQVDTSDFAVDACTSTTINISHLAVTDVVATSVPHSSATFIEVYNADDANVMNCGFDSGVSTTSSNAAYGRELAANSGLGLSLNLDKFPGYYCGTQKTSAATRATITKCR